MAVFLTYGAYRHDDNEVTVSIQRQAIDSGNGRYIGVSETWTVNGRLYADSQVALRLRVLALEAAYSRWGLDLVLYGDGNIVLHELRNRNSTTGVRIVNPISFPDGTGAQYSTFRDYSFTASAEYPVGTGLVLRDFQESITRSGGHRRLVALECAVGPADVQVVAQRTAYRVQQSGSAVAFRGRPLPQPPYWPQWLETETVTEIAPQRANGELSGAGVQWSYSFVSPVPLVGAPATFPGG